MSDTILELALNKKLLFVTGKGGIGKSVIAASLALRAQDLGKSVLLVEQAATDYIGPLFGHSNIGHEPVEVLPGLEVANFNAAGNFQDFIIKHLKFVSLFDSLINNRLVHNFFTAIPGFGELMLLGRLYYTLNLAPTKPDLVIVDSYASGHFLSLMTTPKAVLGSGLAGPISAETQKVETFLEDQSSCGSVVVGTPEELVITEMLELVSQLHARSPVKPAGVLFNHYLNQKQGGAEEKNQDSGSVFLRNKLETQRIAWDFWSDSISKMPDIFRALPVFTAPELGFISEPLTMETARLLVEQPRRMP